MKSIEEETTEINKEVAYMITPEELKEIKELNDALAGLDKTTMLLLKSQAELISRNKELEAENRELVKAAG